MVRRSLGRPVVTGYAYGGGLVVGGFPDASNTGVPAGTSLTPLAGDFFSSSNGQVVDALDMSGGSLVILHDNVTVKRCRVFGAGTACIFIDTGATGTIIEDCEVDSGGAIGNGIAARDCTIRRCDIKGVELGIVIVNPEGNVDILDNWIHDLQRNSADPHIDGINFQDSVANILIEHNTIDQNIANATSCMITTQNPVPPAHQNVTVTNNRLLATSGYCIYEPGAAATNFHITNNRLYDGPGLGGYYSGDHSKITSWSGNVDDITGASIP